MVKKSGARIKWYGDKIGWLILVETPQPIGVLRYACDRMRETQKQRLVGMAPGDSKEECRRSIALLEQYQARQMLSKDQDGGFLHFSSTERLQPTVYFFGEGGTQ